MASVFQCLSELQSTVAYGDLKDLLQFMHILHFLRKCKMCMNCNKGWGQWLCHCLTNSGQYEY